MTVGTGFSRRRISVFSRAVPAVAFVCRQASFAMVETFSLVSWKRLEADATGEAEEANAPGEVSCPPGFSAPGCGLSDSSPFGLIIEVVNLDRKLRRFKARFDPVA